MAQLSEDFLKKIAPVIKHMADTGEGSDLCLDYGCLPVSTTNFYHPVPDIKDLLQRNVFQKKSNLPGILFDVEAHFNFLKELSSKYGMECNWPENPSGEKGAYHWHNQSFGFYCASAAHYVIRHFKPKRIIEVGSGNSSKVIIDALMMNYSETAITPLYKIIDPFPNVDAAGIIFDVEVINKRVESTTPDDFKELGENDILFIDSTHTVKTGGDVTYLIHEVLPLLQKGVIVHFHDIPMPFEYDQAYFTNPSFRVFWNESYLLQAFLAFNSSFQILFSMMGLSEILNSTEAARKELFPNSENGMSGSGSIWLQRIG